MSLPTYGVFYKDNKTVGVGFCNPGWTLTYDTLRFCITECMNNAWDRYRPESEKIVYGEKVNKIITEREKKYDKYFTTEDDLKNFDYVKIFDISIPRSVALSVYFDKNADEVWEEFKKTLDKQ